MRTAQGSEGAAVVAEVAMEVRPAMAEPVAYRLGRRTRSGTIA